MSAKVYLGDGAYCHHDGFQFVLTAENGIRATDTIALKPEALTSFLRFVAKTLSLKITVETEDGRIEKYGSQ